MDMEKNKFRNERYSLASATLNEDDKSFLENLDDIDIDRCRVDLYRKIMYLDTLAYDAFLSLSKEWFAERYRDDYDYALKFGDKNLANNLIDLQKELITLQLDYLEQKSRIDSVRKSFRSIPEMIYGVV